MRGKFLPGVLAFLLLCGCGQQGGLPFAREMGDMALLRTMAVDAGEGEHALSVTVSTGRRARGLQKEEEDPLVLSAQGNSLSGACRTIQGLSESYVFYGYVDQLLLGEELAAQGIEEILNYFARDLELGMGAQVWVVHGRGQDAMLAAQQEGVEERLSTLLVDSEMGTAGQTRTVGEVLSDLLETGGGYLPALRPSDQEETALVEAGYALLQDGALVGWLEGEGAKGLTLLESGAGLGAMEYVVQNRQAVLEEQQVRTTFRPVLEGSRLVAVEIHCRVTADLTEFSDFLTQEDLNDLCLQLEQRERERIQMALVEMQRLGADCIGLGRRLTLANPAHREEISGDWDRIFPQLELRVMVQGEIRHTYGAIR